jgi:hypothetical protein
MPADLQIERGKRIWIRALAVLVVLAAMLFLPSPSTPGAVALFDSLLLIIFAMTVVGLTGPAMVFIVSVSFLITCVLPILVLTWVSMESEGSFSASLSFVLGALTEVDPTGIVFLLVPTAVSAIAGFVLSRGRFTFRFRRNRKI